MAPTSEQKAVKAYLDSNNITATLNQSGFYYSIVSQGSGSTPNLCSHIAVSYKGQLTDGTIFDQETAQIFTLGDLIDGWKKGLPLIQSGGEIKLYIPPSLGYGNVGYKDNNGNIIVPSNSILIFDIDLLSIQ
ncbi:MAG TPA: FKBP-type peptidyl-prolyl cis-trans isomerase [Puia sp.]|nr:FKBP-type peptidyl-prolyl cis-trans isomerase [Puia sp.]